METSKIKQDIKTGNIKPYYIFVGDEVKVQDIYIEKLAQGKAIKRVDSFADIVKKLTAGMLIPTPKCYVIRDDKEIIKEDSIWGNLETLIGSNIVIWVFTTIDKRNKFYKHFKDLICEFNYLSEDVLVKYVQKEINLTEHNTRHLIQICENDYSRILLEIDKIKHLAHNEDYDWAFNILLEEGTIYQPPRDAIFMFSDAVLNRHKMAAFGLLQECVEIGEASLTLISVLYNNVKQVLQVQSCDSKDVVQVSGLTPWQVKCAKAKCGKYSTGELVYALKLIQQVEKGIKSGTMPEELAVPYILVSIM